MLKKKIKKMTRQTDMTDRPHSKAGSYFCSFWPSFLSVIFYQASPLRSEDTAATLLLIWKWQLQKAESSFIFWRLTCSYKWLLQVQRRDAQNTDGSK